MNKGNKVELEYKDQNLKNLQDKNDLKINKMNKSEYQLLINQNRYEPTFLKASKIKGIISNNSNLQIN